MNSIKLVKEDPVHNFFWGQNPINDVNTSHLISERKLRNIRTLMLIYCICLRVYEDLDSKFAIITNF